MIGPRLHMDLMEVLEIFTQDASKRTSMNERVLTAGPSSLAENQAYQGCSFWYFGISDSKLGIVGSCALFKKTVQL